jgi:hypothetical protein
MSGSDLHPCVLGSRPTVGEGDDVSGLRFIDDPLVTVSGQFPLSPSDFSAPERSESPSGSATRPFALRWLVEMGLPSIVTSYRYCPLRQVAVDAVTGEPRPPRGKLAWTTIAHKDGDEGPSKDYAWETVPDAD